MYLGPKCNFEYRVSLCQVFRSEKTERISDGVYDSWAENIMVFFGPNFSVRRDVALLTSLFPSDFQFLLLQVRMLIFEKLERLSVGLFCSGIEVPTNSRNT